MVEEALQAPMRMSSPLTVQFRYAPDDQAFAERYVTEINWQGVAHPVEGRALFRTDYPTLHKTRATVGLGFITATGEVACGLYMVTDGEDRVWIGGVHTLARYQGQGFGSTLVRATVDFIRDSLKLTKIALTVQCDEAGNPRPNPLRCYSRAGFVGVNRPFPVTLSGLPCDCHIGEPGSHFLSQRMEYAT